MKKIIMGLFIFVILMGKVSGKSNDVLTIEKLNTNIIIYEENEFMVNNDYDTSLIFGDNPQTNYFYKVLYNNYKYLYKDKIINSSVDYSNIDMTSNTEFGIYETEKGNTLYFGNPFSRFKPKEKIKAEYYAILEKKEEGIYSYTICKEDYDVKKINFEILMALGYKGKEIKFSLNNKDYSKELKNLSYKIKDNILLEGSYESTLKKGEHLSFILIDKESADVIDINNLFILIVSIVLFIVLSIMLLLRIRKKRLTKKQKSI